MAQSGQFTLELPYAIIGLGTTPNFVEKITVAIPPSKDSVCTLSYTYILFHIYLISGCHQSYVHSNGSQFSNRCHSISNIRSEQVCFVETDEISITN